jgi:hypothetical protein
LQAIWFQRYFSAERSLYSFGTTQGDLEVGIPTCVLSEFKQNQFATGDAKLPVIK